MKKILLGTCLLLLSSAFAADEPYLFFSPEMVTTHLKEYDIEEKELIEKDLNVVRSICFKDPKAKDSEKKPVYIATCGAPGSRKSTILERFLLKQCAPFQFAYLDPDQRALKFMAHTYYSQSLSALAIAEHEHYSQAIKAAYEKWRGASNYIALTLLEEAFLQRKDIAHGTTSTGEHISKFLSKVKEAGYEVVLLLCSCEDTLRHQAVDYRNKEQKFYQSTPEEAVSKGVLFPQRMSSYFTYADTLYLFWSDDLFNPERLAAVITGKDIVIYDQEALTNFISKFEKDRNKLMKEGKQIPSWNELLEIRQ